MSTEENNLTNEDILGPVKVEPLTIWLNALWSLIWWFAGWIIILFSIYFFSLKTGSFSWVYPYIFSLTWFFATLLTSSLNLIMNKIINPEKYKRWSITFVQVFLFSIFLYIFLAPGYLYTAYNHDEMLIYIFTIHILVSILWTSILSEVLSNYRYILIGLYWSFIGFFVSILISIITFLNVTKSNQSLYILIWVIIIINVSINVFRNIFEYIYYLLYKISWLDYLWDIFSQIESEEKEMVEKAKKELEKFN